MPENETLFPDARTATRWQPLKDRLTRGESPNQIFPEFQDEFYRALQRIYKQWKRRGVDPKALFEAAKDDPVALRELIDRTRNDQYAQMLRDATAGEQNANLEGVIRSFLDSVWEHACGQLQIYCLEEGPPDEFLGRVNQMLERLSNGLKKKPSRIPPRPRKNKPRPDIADLLALPLLP